MRNYKAHFATSLRSDVGKFIPMIWKDCTGEAGPRFAHAQIKGSYPPPHLLVTCAPELTGGNFPAEHSGRQAPEPQVGLKQCMISGLPRHVLAYTWFL